MITTQEISQAGIVGAGGAGFPTHVKLAGRCDTIVCNAAECEPLLHKDKELIRLFPQEVILGLETARQLTGAERVVIGLKRKYADLITQFEAQLPSTMSICPLDDVYPSGDEFILVYETLGRVIPPGGIPLQVGAVVMNVETAYNLGNAVNGRPVTHKFLTVGGAVPKPVSLRVPLGCTLAQCIEIAGGPTIENPVVLVGGPMMGFLEEHPESALVTKTTGGIILLPEHHPLVIKMRRPWAEISRIARCACDQCSFCTELCPRNLLGHPVEPHKAMRSLMFGADVLVPGTQFCSGCNLCSRCSCPEGLDPRNVVQANRRKWLESGKRWENPPFRKSRPDVHMKNRKTPIAKLIRRLGLAEFENHGPLDLNRSEQAAFPRVGIRLQQHIGRACEPCVSVGSRVEVGTCVGIPAVVDGKPALGASVHASIAGVVTKIENNIIWIEKR